MLEEARFKLLQDFLNQSSREELIWINGYLSGLVSGGSSVDPQLSLAAAPAQPKKKFTLAYGTETGNAKSLATQLAALAKQKGHLVKLVGLDQYRFSDLSKETCLVIVISTQGEGEPPLPAKKFYDYIHSESLQLPHLHYAVLGLGDTSYPQFCKTAEDVEARFSSFGARPMQPLKKCDVDYEAEAKAWFEELMNSWTAVTSNTSVSLATTTAKPVAKAAGKKYYEAKILANINLNDRGSNKETYHIELGTEEPIAYEPGDTIGIVPHNRKSVVERIIKITGIDPEMQLTTAKHAGSVRELLSKHLNICYLLTSTLKKYAAITGQEIPDTRMDLVDLLRIYPVKHANQFAEVMGILMPIAPRLYSIASSPEAHGETEVHITVARDRFLAQDEQRYGLCSEFLGELPIGSTISFYVHKDKHFKLPAAEKDVIMIGPGTGVAPFRAFLAHRDATGADGRNWFFFGEQHFVSDFLYQTEIQNFLATGVLHKLDLAFSRDQPEKIYVQHRMRKKADELFDWIKGGASVFISGTKDPMSRDVEACLLEIFQQKGSMHEKEAAAYLEQMKKEGRYAKDVY
jgi:sulfite reductase (NADPH) flavoprotein alpha-component